MIRLPRPNPPAASRGGRALPALALAAALLLSPTTDAAPCGTVVIPTGLGADGIAANVASLHPVLDPGSLYDQEAYNLLYRPLLWFAPDHSIDFALSHASAIAVSDDRTVFRVTLHPITWSDGVPVTADDVVYGFELIKALGPAYAGYGTGGIPDLFKSVAAAGPLELDVTLTQPVNPEWLELVGLQQLYALPRHAWSKYSLDEQRSLQTDTGFLSVVDGAFRLAEFNVGRDAVFEPNPTWTGRQPAMARLVLDFLQGVNPLEALQAGELDAASIPFAVYDQAVKLPGFQVVRQQPYSGYNSLMPNMANPAVAFFRDVRVRQAIADAIDQDEIVRLVYHGNSVPVHDSIPPRPEAFLSPDARAGKYPTGYNPQKARALLAAAGWQPGPDGIMVKDGRRLEWTDLLSAGSNDGLVLTQVIQANLAAAGMRMNIRQMEFNQIIATQERDPLGWEMASIAWTFPSYPDMQTNFGTGAGQNFTKYSDPKTDALLAQVSGEPGRDALFALQDYLAAQQPFIFLPQGSYAMLTAPGIAGLTDAVQSNYLWKPEFLTFTGARACDAAQDHHPS